jgi:hypothetical protein
MASMGVDPGLVWFRARSEWRRHSWELLALTVLVGLVGSVVVTAASGARRTRSSVERLDRSTRAVDAIIQFADGQSKVAKLVAALPQVEAADRIAPMSFFNEQGFLPLVASIDGNLGVTVERDRVLRGRRPNAKEPLEVALSEPVAQRLHLDVGGRLRLTGISSQQTECVFAESAQGDPRCAAIRKGFFANPPDFSTFAGPRVAPRVVGITRGLGDVAARADDTGLVVLTPAFYREYHDDVGTQAGVAVRLRAGTTQQEFEAAVARVLPPGAIQNSGGTTALFDGLQSTVGVLANGLLAFAAVAALAGFAAVTQILGRRAAAGMPEREVLRSLGMTRRALIVDVVAPLVPVAVVGAVLSTLGGWLLSGLMPIGTARRVEPYPGLHFDPAVLAGGGGVLAVGVLGAATLSALWVARRSERQTAKRRVEHAWVFGGVPAMVGRRLAFDTGRRHRAVPVRSALSGVVLGVAGVVAVASFGAGLTRLGDEPSRYGYAWDMTISGERTSDPETPQPSPDPTSAYWDRRAARVAADPAVASVTPVWLGFPTRVAGRTVTTFAQRRRRGGTGFVIVAGRAPTGIHEVALGAKTLRGAHVGLGDSVRVANRSMRVVGQAIFPVTSDDYPLADGALLSAEGFNALGIPRSSGLGSAGNNSLAVELRHGADRDAATTRLKALNRDEAPTFARTPPEVDQLEQLDRLPVILASFLLVVALLALGHALVLTVRHRRPDLAVLRTLGMTPSQTARTVAWQAGALAMSGALIGVPLGLVFGRFIWSAVAHSYGIADDTAWPWVAVALALPAAVLLANALAWWPGRRAAHLHPAQILRSE